MTKERFNEIIDLMIALIDKHKMSGICLLTKIIRYNTREITSNEFISIKSIINKNLKMIKGNYDSSGKKDAYGAYKFSNDKSRIRFLNKLKNKS